MGTLNDDGTKMLEVDAICKMNISQEAKDKLMAMYEEFCLLKKKHDLITGDFRAIVVREVISQGLSNDYDLDRKAKVSTLIVELKGAISGEQLPQSFCLENWTERYLLALPAPPLEALIYDEWIFKQFNN